jgi:hypothetical protein
MTAQRWPPSGAPKTDDELRADVAKRVPGFAGVWFHGSTLVLALVDTTQRAAALREVADLLEISPEKYRNVRVQPAQFDFAQLYAWKEAVVTRLLLRDSIPQWTGLDVDEVRNRVVLDVADSSALGPARRAILALGIPPRALLVEIGSYLEPHEKSANPRTGAPPNQRMKLSARDGRVKRNWSILSAAATGCSLCAIR